MPERKFRAVMLMIGLVIVIEILGIIVYPMINTRTDELTIEGIEVWGDGLYHIRTDKEIEPHTVLILHVHKYYYDDLLKDHTYRIKWVKGFRVDRILEFEEVEP